MRPKFEDPYSNFLDYLMPIIGLAFVGLAIFFLTRMADGGAAAKAWSAGFYLSLLVGGAFLFTSLPRLIKKLKGQ